MVGVVAVMVLLLVLAVRLDSESQMPREEQPQRQMPQTRRAWLKQVFCASGNLGLPVGSVSFLRPRESLEGVGCEVEHPKVSATRSEDLQPQPKQQSLDSPTKGGATQ